MIDTLSLEIDHPEQLAFFLASQSVQQKYLRSSGCLVLLYSANVDQFFLSQLLDAATFWCPKAVVAGATSTGEIRHGETLLGKTIATLYFFEHSSVTLESIESEPGCEQEQGRTLAERMQGLRDLKAALLLGNPLKCNFAEVHAGFTSVPLPCPVFGGGAGDYAMEQAWVMAGKLCSQTALVVVGFSGPSLDVELHDVLGWRRMTPSMRITSATGNTVHTIDNRPAGDIYKEFLGISADRQFFSNALGFPLLIREGKQLVAKVPLGADEEGNLEFVSKVSDDEEFSLGFVHPELLEQQLLCLNQKMAAFFPDTVLLFSCGCRRFVLLEDILDETRSFEKIAPTFGFYTVSEIAAERGLLNLSLVAVGMREGAKPNVRPSPPKFVEPDGIARLDQFANTHSRILKRLLHFISALNRELEGKNREMEKLSYLDGLTGIANRRRFDRRLEEDWRSAIRSGRPLSLLMIDVDSFKAFNDTYGHLAGDDCLRQLASKMSASVSRGTDLVARYGGEEFAVIMPNTDGRGGLKVAREIHKRVAALAIPHSDSQADSEVVTVSIGISCMVPAANEDVDKLQHAADRALYQAKSNGRNLIVKASDAFVPSLVAKDTGTL
ncbi:diguanylate cyclase [Shewanella corallii]|uniref:diguanylate cyclase n=1 Tax=Shewanella corallii TaxID=560080 RepID=A0ABT0N8J5_9GAMM|nr:diguanylate cyclase [Shewanella corallii]MCL2914787.1 diguanylate cyclase [Shewanella corallii]